MGKLAVLEELFKQFITDPEHIQELIYCLEQSSVEPFIRFKFGYWLEKNSKSKFNIIEVNRIDLIVAIDNELYFVEFGHRLNLHKPSISDLQNKINEDLNKINSKINIFKQNPLVNGLTIKFCTITLVSDFRLENEIKQDKLYVKYLKDKPNTGVSLKYGRPRNLNDYFINYKEDILEKFCSDKSEINDDLSIWWRYEEHDLDKFISQ